MLREHIEIKVLLGEMAEVIESDEAATRFAGLQKRFMAILGHHNAREERVIYAMTDLGLPPSERETLVLAMQAL